MEQTLNPCEPNSLYLYIYVGKASERIEIHTKREKEREKIIKRTEEILNKIHLYSIPYENLVTSFHCCMEKSF